MTLFKKENLFHGVVLAGVLINLVVIVLILVFFVF